MIYGNSFSWAKKKKKAGALSVLDFHAQKKLTNSITINSEKETHGTITKEQLISLLCITHMHIESSEKTEKIKELENYPCGARIFW